MDGVATWRARGRRPMFRAWMTALAVFAGAAHVVSYLMVLDLALPAPRAFWGPHDTPPALVIPMFLAVGVGPFLATWGAARLRRDFVAGWRLRASGLLAIQVGALAAAVPLLGHGVRLAATPGAGAAAGLGVCCFWLGTLGVAGATAPSLLGRAAAIAGRWAAMGARGRLRAASAGLLVHATLGAATGVVLATDLLLGAPASALWGLTRPALPAACALGGALAVGPWLVLAGVLWLERELSRRGPLRRDALAVAMSGAALASAAALGQGAYLVLTSGGTLAAALLAYGVAGLGLCAAWQVALRGVRRLALQFVTPPRF